MRMFQNDDDGAAGLRPPSLKGARVPSRAVIRAQPLQEPPSRGPRRGQAVAAGPRSGLARPAERPAGVLAITVGAAAGSAHYGWDMDSVAAPVITAAGDVVTLPSLFLATYCVGIRFLSPALGALTAGLAVASLVGVLRSGLPLLKRIVAESLPILLMAGAI